MNFDFGRTAPPGNVNPAKVNAESFLDFSKLHIFPSCSCQTVRAVDGMIPREHASIEGGVVPFHRPCDFAVRRAEIEIETSSTVRRKEDIEAMLAHGLAPITDNVEALIELGFTRSYPAAQGGYEATVWERAVDRGYRSTCSGLRRVMVCQRAFARPYATDIGAVAAESRRS